MPRLRSKVNASKEAPEDILGHVKDINVSHDPEIVLTIVFNCLPTQINDLKYLILFKRLIFVFFMSETYSVRPTSQDDTLIVKNSLFMLFCFLLIFNGTPGDGN